MRPSHRKHNRMWPRMRDVGASPTLVSSSEILKELYPQAGSWEYKRPWWAYLARDRRWITSAGFWAIPRERTGKRHPGIASMYENFPFISLVKRTSRPGCTTTTW